MPFDNSFNSHPNAKSIEWKVLSNGCWLCLSHKATGSGSVYKMINGKKFELTHLFYEKYLGPIPKLREVRHLCAHIWCINPHHFFAGTRQGGTIYLCKTGKRPPPPSMRGEQNPCSKLTNQEALKIFKIGGTYAKIAADFNITQGIVGAIKTGKSWGTVIKKIRFKPPRVPRRKKRRTRKPIEWKEEPNGCWRCISHAPRSLRKQSNALDSRGICTSVSRQIYEERFGSIPEGIEIGHKCGMWGCINPAHFLVGSRKIIHRYSISKGRSPDLSLWKGEKSTNPKLTEEIARKIFEMTGSQKQIAQDFGISIGTVRRIKYKRAWTEATKNAKLGPLTGRLFASSTGRLCTSKLTNKEAIKIFELTHTREGKKLPYGTLRKIARDFGIAPLSVWEIKTGRTWGSVTGAVKQEAPSD
jgi:hypothetical protein